MMDIVIIDTNRNVVIENDNEYPITHIYDADGNETTDWSVAITCIAGVGCYWLTINVGGKIGGLH